MKKILVTGGAGYVGSILLRKLISHNYHVVCIDNLRFTGESLLDIWQHPHFFFHHCDITDYNEINKVFNKYKIFAVIHLAAIVGDPACKREPELAKKINGDASNFLLEKSIQNQVERFIFASTCSNYGKMKETDGYVNENSHLAPVSLYARLKVDFENKILSEKQSSFYPTILRFATVYGLSHRMRFDLTVNEFTKELSLGRELIVFGEQFWRPYCHVLDFSNAMLTVLNTPKEKVAYEVFNVGSTQENYTKSMIVEELVKQIPNSRIKFVVKEEDPRDYRVDFSKIQQNLNFSISKTVPEGIQEIHQVIQSKVIGHPDNQKYYNIPYEAPKNV